MLKTGDKIPSFVLFNQDGEKVSSFELKGQKYILYFYPKDDTPGCTKEACGFKSLHKKFEKQGYQIYGVSKDSEESHIKFREKFKLPFDLLCDPQCTVAKKFGAFGEKNMYGKKVMGLIRSTFVINEKGKVELSYKVSRAADHPEKVFADLA